MPRIARIIVLCFAVIGGFYVAVLVALSFGRVCTLQQTALVPSPTSRYDASVGIEQCGKDETSELTVAVFERSDQRDAPLVNQIVFMAKSRGAGGDIARQIHATWKNDDALEISYPDGLEAVSRSDKAGSIAVSYAGTEMR